MQPICDCPVLTHQTQESNFWLFPEGGFRDEALRRHARSSRDIDRRLMRPPNLREYYFTGPRVMVVSSAITSNALMLNVGSPFISATIGPSTKAFTAASSSNR